MGENELRLIRYDGLGPPLPLVPWISIRLLFPFRVLVFFFCFFEHTIDIPDGIMIRACIMHLAGAAVIVSWAYSTQRRVSFNGEKPGGQWGSSSHFLRCGDIRHCGLKREGHLNNRNKNKNKKKQNKNKANNYQSKKGKIAAEKDMEIKENLKQQ